MSVEKPISQRLSEGRRGGDLLWVRAATPRLGRSQPGREEESGPGRAKGQAGTPGVLGTTRAQRAWYTMKGPQRRVPLTSCQLALIRKEDRACQAGGMMLDMW